MLKGDDPCFKGICGKNRVCANGTDVCACQDLWKVDLIVLINL